SAIAATVLWSILAALGGFGGAFLGEKWGVASAGGAAARPEAQAYCIIGGSIAGAAVGGFGCSLLVWTVSAVARRHLRALRRASGAPMAGLSHGALGLSAGL